MLADKQILGSLMNCTCIDLHGKCLYYTGIIYRKEHWIGGKTGVRGGGCWQVQVGGRCVCGDADIWIKIGYWRDRGGLATEPKKLEINCRRHTASHYSGATWPRSTLSLSISYYNHANCGQIGDLTYWYNIPVHPEGYESLLEANNSM